MTDYWYVSRTWVTKQLLPDLQAVFAEWLIVKMLTC